MPKKSSIRRSSTNGMPHIGRRSWINLVIIGLLLYVIVPAAAGLGDSLAAIKNASPLFVVAAAASIFASYCFAALTYLLLAARPIQYWPTLIVQLAGGFVNRLLPAGIGGLGLNLLYLKHSRHSYASATAVVGTNNSLGVIGNSILILAALAFEPDAFKDMLTIRPPAVVLYVAATVLTGLSVFLILQRSSWKRRIRNFIGDILASLRQYAHRPVALFAALLSSMCLTALHVAGLYFVGSALGLDITPLLALFAISAGAFIGAAIPTPGGLGGAEAGIAAVLAASGMPATDAVGAAILYRLLTFWLPLLPGFILFRIVQKKYI